MMRGTSVVSWVGPAAGVAVVASSPDQRMSPSPAGCGVGVAFMAGRGVAGLTVAIGGVLVAGATIVGPPPQAVSRVRHRPAAGTRAGPRRSFNQLPG